MSHRTFTDEEKAYIVAQYPTMGINKIGHRLGCGQQAIQSVLSELGIAPRRQKAKRDPYDLQYIPERAHWRAIVAAHYKALGLHNVSRTYGGEA